MKSKSLKAISRIFEINNFSKSSGEYYYQSKLLERESLSGIDKFKSNISLLLCGYGERPLFTSISIVATILVFSLVYMFTGINVNGTPLNYTVSANGTPVGVLRAFSDYGKCVFFSITTFSTVGYGNYLPSGLWSTVLSAVQMTTGVGLSALWTGCVLRKLLR